MLPRLRATVIALGVFIALPAASQQVPTPSGAPNVQSTQIPSGNQPEAAQNEHTPAAKLPVLDPAKSPQDQKPGGNRAQSNEGVGTVESGHASYEQTIANFTIALAIATFGLMIVTLGLWWETRKLAKQAVIASEDTKRSIEISEQAAGQTARAAQAAVDAVGAERAWIISNGTSSGSLTDSIVGGKKFEIAFFINNIWTNLGRSPAIEVELYSKLQIVDPNQGVPLFDVAGDAPVEKSAAVVGPGVSVNSALMVVDHKDMVNVASKNSRLFIYSKGTYKTTHDVDAIRYTELCLEIEVTKIEVAANKSYIYHIMVAPKGSQNYAV